MRIAKKTNKEAIYLDHASTTPLGADVLKVMQPFWSKHYGNASALHRMGIASAKVLADARGAIARILSAHPDEIIFTSGGTESDNLAVIGVIENVLRHMKRPHIITTSIEHPAVLEACRYAETRGADVTYLPVGTNGIVDPKDVHDALRETTVLVTIMYANNEIGTIQPIQEIAKVIRHFRRHSKNSETTSLPLYPFFHTDATQAVNYLPINTAKLGVDMLTFNGSKIYGPKGIGALYRRRGVPLSPMLHGGDQEFGLRAGTENIPLIAGLAQALATVEQMKPKESARLSSLRDYFFTRLASAFPWAIINGDMNNRLPNNVNVSFPEYESDFLIIELDARGIFASGKSACKSGEERMSHVIRAIRPDADETEGSVRFSLGRATKKKDLDRTIRALEEIFKKQEQWQ